MVELRTNTLLVINYGMENYFVQNTLKTDNSLLTFGINERNSDSSDYMMYIFSNKNQSCLHTIDISYFH